MLTSELKREDFFRSYHRFFYFCRKQRDLAAFLLKFSIQLVYFCRQFIFNTRQFVHFNQDLRLLFHFRKKTVKK